MKWLLPFLALFVSLGASADEQLTHSNTSEDSTPKPLATLGLFGGAGYSNSVNFTPTLGISVHYKNVAFSKDEPGNWDAGTLIYFFPWSQAGYSLYIYAGYCFLSQHELSIGPLIGVTAQGPSVFNYAFTAGGQISYDLPHVWKFSLVPTLAVVGNTIAVPTSVVLFTIELRYSMPSPRYKPTEK